MYRAFSQHCLRKETDLCGLWNVEIDGKQMLLPVPSCWENHPGLENYRGVGVYTRSITVAETTNLRFVFRGVSHITHVFLDGELIGGHEDAYTAFDCVVKQVAPGQHILTVQVDNRLTEASALHVANDYMTYGGIIRPCYVEHVADGYIQHVHAVPRWQDGQWTLHIRACVRLLAELEQPAVLKIEACGKTIELAAMLQPGENLLEGVLHPGEVEAWSPDFPTLYEVKATLTQSDRPVDDLVERIGFRRVEVSASRVLLNGEPIRLMGFNRHDDWANFGCAVPSAAMLHDLALMRDMGMNAVRTSHYPNDPLFLDYCDELGMLVWEEGHARGLSEAQMRNPNFMRQSRASLSEMMVQHMCHPSIILWGLLNECASDTPYGLACYTELISLMRGLDDSRPIVSASCKRGKDWGMDAAMVCSEAGDLTHGLTDVTCHNIYPEWYLPVSAADMIEQTYQGTQQVGGAGKPFIVSEIGAGALYGYHDVRRAKWSEERQSDILASQLDALLANEHVAGFFIWQFCDNRVTPEGGWFRDRARTMNNKGVVDEYRRPKMAYATVKAKLENVCAD